MNAITTPIQLTRQDRLKIFGQMINLFLQNRGVSIRIAASMMHMTEKRLQELVVTGDFTMTELMVFCEVYRLDPVALFNEFHMCCSEVMYGKPVGSFIELPWGCRYILTKKTAHNTDMPSKTTVAPLVAPKPVQSAVPDTCDVPKLGRKRKNRTEQAIEFYNENKHLADCTLQAFISRMRHSHDSMRERILMPRHGEATTENGRFFRSHIHLARVSYSIFLKRLDSGMTRYEAVTTPPTNEELQFVFTK